MKEVSARWIDPVMLGACKYEMGDDNLSCHCPYADEFCAVGLKKYGMRCSKHDTEKVHANGIPKQLLDGKSDDG